MRFGLSGTAGFGRSRTPDTDFRERAGLANPQKSSRNRTTSNGANRKESFGFLLTARAAVDSAALLAGSTLAQRPGRRPRTAPVASLIPGDLP